MKKTLLWMVLLSVAVLFAAGCQKSEQEPPAQEEQVSQTEEEMTPLTPAKARPEVSRAGVDAVTFEPGTKPRVELQTSLGTMVLELWPDVAPVHCKNFVYLAEAGFYDSVLIHRVIPGFVLQSGDPLGTGMGGPGYNIEAEFSDKKHVKGTLSMARSRDVNSAGSQFFICLAPTPNLDGQYTAFGQVVEGMDVVDKFNQVVTVPSATGEKSKPQEPLYLSKATVLSK